MRPIERVLAEAHGDFARTQLRRTLVTRHGKQGRLLPEVPWPVLDLIEADRNVEQELVKYLVKDAELEDGKLKRIPEELHARLYEGLEGLRTIATSRRLFQDESRTCACDECGSTRLARTRAKPDEATSPEKTKPERLIGGTTP